MDFFSLNKRKFWNFISNSDFFQLFWNFYNFSIILSQLDLKGEKIWFVFFKKRKLNLVSFSPPNLYHLIPYTQFDFFFCHLNLCLFIVFFSKFYFFQQKIKIILIAEPRSIYAWKFEYLFGKFVFSVNE